MEIWYRKILLIILIAFPSLEENFINNNLLGMFFLLLSTELIYRKLSLFFRHSSFNKEVKTLPPDYFLLKREYLIVLRKRLSTSNIALSEKSINITLLDLKVFLLQRNKCGIAERLVLGSENFEILDDTVAA